MIGSCVRTALLLVAMLFSVRPAIAAAPVVIGPEILLPGAAAAAAFGDAHFFAVWPCGAAICGARMSATGGAVEAHTLVTTVASPSQVRVAFDGSQFLVVWAETRDRLDIYAARFTPDGTTLDPGGFVVSRDLMPYMEGAGRYSRYSPAVAASPGNGFHVQWLETVYSDGSLALYSTGVSNAGEVLSPAGYYTLLGQGIQVDLSNDGAARTWVHGRYGLAGIVALGWDLHAGNVTLTSPDVSAGGERDLIVFAARDDYWLFHGGGTFGHLIGTPPQSLIHFSITGASPLAAYDGTDHIVVWSESNGMVGLRLAPSAGLVETREACVVPGLCTQVSIPDFAAPGAPTTLTSNGRGVSLVTSQDSARLLVSNFDLAVSDALGAALAEVSALPDDALKNRKTQAALAKRLAAIRDDILSDAYPEAAFELESLIGKTNGCALRLAPDKNDWIRNCQAQNSLYSILNWTLYLVRQVMPATVAST